MHFRNCDGPFRTSGAGCLVPVLSSCMITLGRTRLDGQEDSCRSSVRRCLIIHPTARTSLPVISIFFYTSINSISVLRMTERRRWLSHIDSNLRLNTCCICCNKYFHEIVFCFCKRPQGTLLTG
jgi:hypothetical protein